MPNKFEDLAKQFQLIQRLMKDEHVRTLLSHPKVQDAFKDPEFQAAMRSQDPAKIMNHPKMAALMKDPDVAPLLAKIDPRTLLAG